MGTRLLGHRVALDAELGEHGVENVQECRLTRCKRQVDSENAGWDGQAGICNAERVAMTHRRDDSRQAWMEDASVLHALPPSIRR